MEAFTSQYSFTGNLHHALGTGNIFNLTHQAWISIFQSDFKPSRLVLTASKMSGWIPDC